MEPTPEQKLKTIRLARQMSKNIWEQQLGPLLKEFAEWQHQQLESAPPWARAKPEPVEEDPAEREQLLAVLAEAKTKGNAK